MVSRSAAGTQWTWKKVTVVVDSGAAENVMPWSMFPYIGIRQTERSKNGKGSRDIKNCGHRTLEALRDSYARARGRLQT